MKMIASLLFLLILTIPKAQAQPNMVLCWIFKMQGCPGVEAVAGKARNYKNSGIGGIGAAGIGGKTSRVESKFDRFIRKLFGRKLINISYETDGRGCNKLGDTLVTSSNALFKSNNAKECMRALDQDLRLVPRGINLQILQCRDHFCNEDFIEVFDAFLEDHPQLNISDSSKFLGCPPDSVEI